VATNIRRQLTLFVEQQDSESIEKIRQQFNPRQSELIKSHVTLCREDEIENLEQVIINLYRLTMTEIVIEFGEISRFDNGKGLLLSAKADNIEFQELRKQILHGMNDHPGKQEPHITLMHPRNSTCTDNIFAQIKKISLPAKLKFKKICLIEQKDGGQWNVLREFKFKDRT
jgi:2'-5' RNA ligase superfamily